MHRAKLLPMNDVVPPTRWHFRLQLLTAVGVLMLVALVIRARAAHSRVEGQREDLRLALRGLLTAQEERHADHGRFATALDSTLAWRPPGHLTLHFEALDDQNWRAVITDTALVIPPTHCGTYLGRPSNAPHRSVLAPGEVRCW
jgi:hypothetical protein